MARVPMLLTIGALLTGCADAASSVGEGSGAPASNRTSVGSSTESAAATSGTPPPAASASAATVAASSNASTSLLREAPSMNLRKADAGPKGDAAALSKAVAARERELLACYDEARALDRTLMGRVMVSFTLGASGKPDKIKTGGDLPEALRTCVVAQLQVADLPRPGEDTPSSLVVEFEPGRVHLRLNGKAYYDATGDDVKAALKALGCTDLTDESGKGRPRRYRAMLDGKHLVVTFTPKTSTANPGAFHMSARQINDLRARAAVFQATDFILAIRVEEDPDTKAAEALLRRIVTEE